MCLALAAALHVQAPAPLDAALADSSTSWASLLLWSLVASALPGDDSALAEEAISDVSVRSERFLQSIARPLLMQPATPLNRCGVMLIGIDGFENMLHTHGRLTADAALQAVAQALTQSVRASDIVGRVGYDGFAVVLSVADPEVVMIAARRIRDGIQRIAIPVANDGKLALSASLGLAVRNSEDTMEAAFGLAHDALRQAIEQGCGEIRQA